MMKHLLSATLLALLALMSVPPPAANAADQPQISLSADKKKVGVDDTLELELSVSGTSPSADPVIEGAEHFEQLGTSKGEQLSIVNMNITRATTWRYTFRPKKAGESVTLRAKVPVGGTNYFSGTVAVETTQGGGGPARQQPYGLFNHSIPRLFGSHGYSKDDFILQARVTPASVWAGEEAVYTLAFYRGADVFSNINFMPPIFKNVWTEQPDEGNRLETKEARLGGRGYVLTEMRTLLYPLLGSDLMIPAASVSFQPDPFSPAISIKSNELTLKVKPLPEKGKPAGFSGLVGNFSITASLSNKNGVVGQPLTLVITVSGRGAMHAIPKPAQPAIDAERYDPEIKDAFRRGARGSEGSRAFSYIIVPKKEGTLVIPPISIDFFNPASAAYETAKTVPLSASIAAAGSAVPAAPPSAPPEVKSPAPPEGTPFYRRQFFYAFLATLLVAVIGAKVYHDRRQAIRVGGAAHALRAEPLALERLARAEKLLRQNDTAGFLAAAEYAVRGYLSDRLNIPPSAVTPDDIVRRLPAETRERYRECLSVLQACFDARYSPAVFENSAALLERAKKAVKAEA